MATKKVKEETTEAVVEEVVEKKEPSKKYGVVANCTALNVRKERAMEAPVVGVVYPGDKCEITGEYPKSNWYGVKFENGLEGYCVSYYITVSE